MADKRDQWVESFSAEPQGGWMTGFLAGEEKGVRRLMWRLGSWGVAAVCAVAVAVLAGRYEIQLRSDQFAIADAQSRQEQQLHRLTRVAQVENRRLSQAIDTLNSDRDRLFARMASVEQGLESATGSILARPALPPPPPREPPPQVAAPASQPSPPPSILTEPKTAATPADLPTLPIKPPENSPPDATAKVVIEPPSTPRTATPAASTTPKSDDTTGSEPAAATAEPRSVAPKALEPAPSVQMAAVALAPAEVATPVARTDFGVDIGGANSVDGLRAIWHGLSKTPALNGLHPIIVVRERRNGLGMQLRLVVGPLTDAAAAARICATLAENKRACETSVFDGQRLALKNEAASVESPAASPPAVPKPPRPPHQRRVPPKPEPAPAPKPEQRSEHPQPKPVEEAQVQAPKPTPSLSTILGFSRE